MRFMLFKAYTCRFEKLCYKCEFDNDENVVGYYNDLYFKKKIKPVDTRF